MNTLSPRESANRFAIQLTVGLLLGIATAALFLSSERGTAPHDDLTITRAVEERLAGISGASIDVRTVNGIVTLTGRVRNPSEKRSSTEIALNNGAVRVINRLEVSPS